MHRVTGFTARMILRGLSWLPRFALILTARLIEFILYRIAGYRLSVTRENIRRSFPVLSDQNRKEIERRFYRHLSELIPEMILYIRIRNEMMDSHFMTLENPSVLESYRAEGRNLILTMGHFGNWEWSVMPFIASGYRIIGVYKPPSSRLADGIIRWIRQKPGIILVPMAGAIRALHREAVSGSGPFALILISDQTPARGDIHYWTTFLGQETAFFTGAEKIAAKFNATVLYCEQSKVSFGRYRMNLTPINIGPGPTAGHPLTDMFVARLEGSIRHTPWLWLWSHRRWKYHKDDVPLGP